MKFEINNSQVYLYQTSWVSMKLTLLTYYLKLKTTLSCNINLFYQTYLISLMT